MGIMKSELEKFKLYYEHHSDGYFIWNLIKRKKG